MDVMQQCNKTPLYCLPLCHHTNKFVIHSSTLLRQYLSSITNFGDLGSEWHSAIFFTEKGRGVFIRDWAFIYSDSFYIAYGSHMVGYIVFFPTKFDWLVGWC